MPRNIRVIDIKPKNNSVIDQKPKMNAVQGETVAYTEIVVLLAGMPIPFGGAFHTTYPTAITVQQNRP